MRTERPALQPGQHLLQAQVLRSKQLGLPELLLAWILQLVPLVSFPEPERGFEWGRELEQELRFRASVQRMVLPALSQMPAREQEQILLAWTPQLEQVFGSGQQQRRPAWFQQAEMVLQAWQEQEKLLILVHRAC